MNKLLKLTISFAIVLLTSCQAPVLRTHLPDTIVKETKFVDVTSLVKANQHTIQITEKTVMLDARSAFEYNIGHLPGAVPLSWEDFTDPQAKIPARLRSDLRPLVRRLSLLGISIDTPVLVVGSGKLGMGEEGRLAWTLFYLGIRNIQIASQAYFRRGLTTDASPVRANEPLWQAKFKPSVVMTAKEFFAQKPKVIDVRTEKEYFAKGEHGNYASPDLNAIHIDWREFFTDDGRVNLKLKPKLEAVGITTRDRIAVVSDDGVRSGAVTFALLSLGFSGAANVAGGFPELFEK